MPSSVKEMLTVANAAVPRVPPADRMRRLWAFLMRRGFPAGLVHERLRALWPTQGEILEGLEVVSETE